MRISVIIATIAICLGILADVSYHAHTTERLRLIEEDVQTIGNAMAIHDFAIQVIGNEVFNKENIVLEGEPPEL